MCSSARMEVAEKSYWLQGIPTVAGYSDGGSGLPELITGRNPNPSILKLFYGSDTMLREK